MPDRPEAPPRSPFAPPPQAPAAPVEEERALFESLGYSPDELEPIPEAVVPLVAHWSHTRHEGTASLGRGGALGEIEDAPADAPAWGDPCQTGDEGWSLDAAFDRLR